MGIFRMQTGKVVRKRRVEQDIEEREITVQRVAEIRINQTQVIRGPAAVLVE